MPVAQPARVPAGVPAGGRFAASRHTDPGTDLLESTDPATERELFDRFTASARHWGNRLGVDTDDLLQDTAVEFYATLARQRGADDPQPGLNGRVVKTATRPTQSRMVNPGGWIHRIAYNIAARRVAGTNSSADLAALREYRNRLQQAENDRGRQLSVAEADRLADEIRMSRPPRRRPTPGLTAGRGPCPPRHSDRTGTSPPNRTRWAAAVPSPHCRCRGGKAAHRKLQPRTARGEGLGVGRGGRRHRRSGSCSRRATRHPDRRKGSNPAGDRSAGTDRCPVRTRNPRPDRDVRLGRRRPQIGEPRRAPQDLRRMPSDAMKERGLAPRGTPEVVETGGCSRPSTKEAPCERILFGSAVRGNRSAPATVGDRPDDHRR